jgi:hypothetical protein
LTSADQIHLKLTASAAGTSGRPVTPGAFTGALDEYRANQPLRRFGPASWTGYIIVGGGDRPELLEFLAAFPAAEHINRHLFLPLMYYYQSIQGRPRGM